MAKQQQPIPDPVAALESELVQSGVTPVLSLRQAAAISGKSAAVLARLARGGVLTAHRTPSLQGPGNYRITRHDLARFLAGEEAR
jgi:hypothetical protein